MTATKLTADAYIASAHERSRWTQLISGEVIVNNPTIRHQKIVSYIHFQLMLWVNAGSDRGESPGQIDVQVDGANVVAPDVSWFAAGRLPSDGSHSKLMPDIVVEVRSPSTWRFDTTTKFRLYESGGVSEVWLVDTTSSTISVFRRTTTTSITFDAPEVLAGGDQLTTPLLSGFTVDVNEVFAR